MTEKWTRWNPTQANEGLYSLDNISGSLWDIDLHLTSLEHKLIIRFEFVLIAYRSTHQFYRTRSLQELQHQLGSAALNWSFFIVENSKYSHWMSQQSGAFDGRHATNFVHYAFVTPEVVIDVANWGNPDNPIIKIQNL